MGLGHIALNLDSLRVPYQHLQRRKQLSSRPGAGLDIGLVRTQSFACRCQIFAVTEYTACDVDRTVNGKAGVHCGRILASCVPYARQKPRVSLCADCAGVVA